MKLGRSFCYWLSKWGEITFAEKFGMPSDRAINELGDGGKPSKAVALEVIKEWLKLGWCITNYLLNLFRHTFSYEHSVPP